MKTAPNTPTKATNERRPPAWLLAAFAALVVATMLAPSESAALRGTHAALCIGWFALFLTYAGLVASGRVSLPALNLYATKPLTPASRSLGAKILAMSLRLARDEWLLLFLAIWMTCGVWGHAQTGDARAMLNVYCQWLAWICAYFLTRWLVRTPEAIRVVVVILLAVVLGQASYGGYQRWVVLPELERAYRLDPERVLAAQGIPTVPGNALRVAYEERIEGRAPTGAFLHPNSLAGLLAAAATLLAGIAVSSWRSRGSQSLGRWRVVATTLLAGIITLTCLAATSSRGGIVASALGMTLAFCWPRSGLGGLVREWSTRRLVGSGAVLFLGIAAGVAFLSSRWGQSAWRSLTVRGDYWRATMTMLADFPLWGCGLGNFQDYYTSYRPAWASEVVADPHNAWLEVAATAGIPAAIALAIIQFVGVLRAAGLPNMSLPTKTDEEDVRSRVVDRSAIQRWSEQRSLLIGALLGVPLVCLCAGLVLRMPPPMLFVTGLPLAIALAWGLRAWMSDGCVTPALLISPVIALLANLTISGGISYGGIAIVLWTLLALARNAEESSRHSLFEPLISSDVAVEKTTERPRHDGQRAIGLVLMGLGAALLVAAHLTMFAPIHRSQTLLARAALASDLGEFDESARWCREATLADRWSAEAARRWCEAEWRRSSAARDNRDQENLRDELEQAIDLAVARAPRSAALRGWLGNQFLSAARRSNPHSQRAFLERAAEEYRAAASLFPTSALAWGQWAYAESLLGRRQSSAEAIRRAYELDAQQIPNVPRLASHPLFDDPQPLEPAQATLERLQRDAGER